MQQPSTPPLSGVRWPGVPPNTASTPTARASPKLSSKPHSLPPTPPILGSGNSSSGGVATNVYAVGRPPQFTSISMGQSTPPTTTRPISTTSRPPLYAYPSSGTREPHQPQTAPQPQQAPHHINGTDKMSAQRKRISTHGTSLSIASGSGSGGEGGGMMFDSSDSGASTRHQGRVAATGLAGFSTPPLVGLTTTSPTATHSGLMSSGSGSLSNQPSPIHAHFWNPAAMNAVPSPHLIPRSSSPSLVIGNSYSPHIFAQSPTHLSPSHHAFPASAVDPHAAYDEYHHSHTEPASMHPKARKEVARLKAAIKRQKVVFATIMSLVAFFFIRIVLVPFLQSAKMEAYFTGARGGYTARLAAEDSLASQAAIRKDSDSLASHPLLQSLDARTTVLVDSPQVLAAIGSNQLILERRQVGDQGQKRAVLELEERLEHVIEQSMAIPNDVNTVNSSLHLESILNANRSGASLLPALSEDFTSDKSTYWLASYLAMASAAVQQEKSAGREPQSESPLPISHPDNPAKVFDIAAALLHGTDPNAPEQDVGPTIPKVIPRWASAKDEKIETRDISPSQTSRDQDEKQTNVSSNELTSARSQSCSWDSLSRKVAVDDRGFLCPVRLINPSTGCCNSTDRLVAAPNAENCLSSVHLNGQSSSDSRGQCFTSFEQCVSCCISSPQLPGYRPKGVVTPIPLVAQGSGRKFDACRLSCRVGSKSLTGRKRVSKFAGIPLARMLEQPQNTSKFMNPVELQSLHTLPVYEPGYSEVHLYYTTEHKHCFEPVPIS